MDLANENALLNLFFAVVDVVAILLLLLLLLLLLMLLLLLLNCLTYLTPTYPGFVHVYPEPGLWWDHARQFHAFPTSQNPAYGVKLAN